MAENVLARYAPAARPSGNLLARMGYSGGSYDLPATPSRDVLTMPTPQRGNEVRDYGRNLLAQMAGDAPASFAANTVMGFGFSPAAFGPAVRLPFISSRLNRADAEMYRLDEAMMRQVRREMPQLNVRPEDVARLGRDIAENPYAAVDAATARQRAEAARRAMESFAADLLDNPFAGQ